MSNALPTLLVIGAMLGGGIVLLNPELRCSLLGLCGNNNKQEAVTPPPPPPQKEEQEDDNGNPIFITNTPPPVIVTPPSQYYIAPTKVIRYATNKCCECKTHSDGIARCRTRNFGDYTISYSSAKYDVERAASLCAKNRCSDPSPRPQPQPPACPTQITRNGTKYYLTNLTKLPDVMTMQYPPTYIKEGNCVYQILSNPTPQPAPTPEPKNNNDSILCKTFPFLCSSSSNLALSLHGRKMSVF